MSATTSRVSFAGSDEQRILIENAIPRAALAKPLKKRKRLVRPSKSISLA